MENIKEVFNSLFSEYNSLEVELSYLEDLMGILERVINSDIENKSKDAKIFREESKSTYSEALSSIDNILRFNTRIRNKIERIENYLNSENVQKTFE